MKPQVTKSICKVGTRGSALARTQTNTIQQTLQVQGFNSETVIVTTQGDLDRRPFTQLTGDGFFTKEIETQLLYKKIDLAVHSAKDLPSLRHELLPWSAVGERENPKDILLLRKDFGVQSLDQLAQKEFCLGSSSPRRKSQAQKEFPKVRVQELRGNVPTRIEKLRSGDYDAILLARAGVQRLGLLEDLKKSEDLLCFELPWASAPNQGIVAVQANLDSQDILKKIAHTENTLIARAEKAFLSFLGGGCHLPLGANIEKKDSENYELKLFFGGDSQVPFCNEKIQASTLAVLVRAGFTKLLQQNQTSGKRCILTQPLQHQLKYARVLYANGISTFNWPLTEIRPTFELRKIENQIRELPSSVGFVFTSQFGVDLFFRELHFRSPELQKKLIEAPVFAIGPATRAALLSHGISNVEISEQSHGESLFQELQNKYPKMHWVLPTTPESRLGLILEKNSIPFTLFDLYRSFPADGLLTDAPKTVELDDILFVSAPSIATQLAQRQNWCQKFQGWLISTGPSTSKALKDLGFAKIKECSTASPESLVEAIQGL